VISTTGSGNDVTGNGRGCSRAGNGRDTFSCVHTYRQDAYVNAAVILGRSPVDLQEVFLRPPLSYIALENAQKM